MSNNKQSHRMEALEWWRQLSRLEQLEIVWKYSDEKDFVYVSKSSSQIQKLYILVTASKTDAIAQNKWRIENREQLRKERKEKLKELMEKDKQQTAMQEHIAWLKKQLQQCIDDGYSESWISAYKLAIKHAELMLENEKKQIILAITANLPIEDGVFTAIDKAHKYYNETFGE